ncbi:MAG: hypothetical protein U0270_00305 [Labilithrix sp.]
MMHGGVVFRRSPPGTAPGLAFLPATIALKVLPVPSIAHVPGAPSELRGVALVDGDMIAIVSAGSLQSEAMLVCAVLGEQIGLVGIEVVATGKFEAADGGDVHLGPKDAADQEGRIARAFDVATLIAKVREGRWGVTLPEL